MLTCDEQDVVFIIRKNGSVEGRATLEAGPQAKGPPLTLLVDKGTASAAEVFAAAVRYENVVVVNVSASCVPLDCVQAKECSPKMTSAAQNTRGVERRSLG